LVWVCIAAVALVVTQLGSIRLGITGGFAVGASLIAYGVYLAGSSLGAAFGVKPVAAIESQIAWARVHRFAGILYSLLGMLVAFSATTALSWVWVAILGVIAAIVIVERLARWVASSPVMRR